MTITIYTDGSCVGNGKAENSGGWGAIININNALGNHSQELKGGELNTTNNRMELMACIQALKYIGCAGEKVIIHSDSKYVVDCFKERWYAGWIARGWRNSAGQPVKNIDLWKELLVLVEPNDCSFKWVKGHVGNPLNERADYLANVGRRQALYENQERMKTNV